LGRQWAVDARLATAFDHHMFGLAAASCAAPLSSLGHLSGSGSLFSAMMDAVPAASVAQQDVAGSSGAPVPAGCGSGQLFAADAYGECRLLGLPGWLGLQQAQQAQAVRDRKGVCDARGSERVRGDSCRPLRRSGGWRRALRTARVQRQTPTWQMRWCAG
jgi:hypothetical protein